MNDIHQEILATLNEIKKWIRFSGWINVKNLLIDNLNTPEKIVAYSLTDGNTGIRDIIQKTGMSFRAVRGCWTIWTQVGIVDAIEFGRGTRAKAIFDLGDFGIEIPELEIEEKEMEVETENEQ